MPPVYACACAHQDLMHWRVPPCAPGCRYTLEYASPEALRHGTSRSGPPGDIWSVGVVIVELLLGRTPAFALKMAELADPSRHGAREKWVRQHPPHQHAMAELLDGGVTVSREMAQVIERSLQVCGLLLFDDWGHWAAKFAAAVGVAVSGAGPVLVPGVSHLLIQDQVEVVKQAGNTCS